jgi:hypothetical protein
VKDDPITRLKEGASLLPVALSIVLSLLVCTLVGFRMLLLARKTRRLPELCIGLARSAFALAQVSRLVFGGLGDRLGPELMLGVYVFMELSYWLAQLGLCLFTVAVFDLRSRWRWAWPTPS